MNALHFFRLLIVFSFLGVISLNSYGQRNHVPKEIDNTTLQRGGICTSMSIINPFCNGGYLSWTPVSQGNSDYLLTVTYQDGGLGIYKTILVTGNSITRDEINSLLYPLPTTLDPNNLYRLYITPVDNCQDKELALYYTRSELCPTQGGAKGFAVIDDPGNSKFSGFVNGKNKDKNQCTISPNPIQNHLIIDAQLTKDQLISAHLYNANGQLVQQLTNKRSYNKGSHILTYDTTDLAEGIYYCVMTIGEERIVEKLVKL